MRPSRTPWPPPPRSCSAPATALAAVALLLPACVTSGTYQKVVAERDALAEARDALQVRVERLEISTDSLESERVQLFEQTEALAAARAELEEQVRVKEEALAQRERELADAEGALEEQQRAHAASVAAAEAELARIRETYDSLVGDLETEVEAGRVAIQRLRDAPSFSMPSEVVFPPGSAEPTAEGLRVLRRVGQRLAKGSERIEVHGHTDSLPTGGEVAARFPTNWELAGARAARVVRILVDAGVAPERVVAVSHASFDPVASDATPEGRAQNRRIEIRLLPPAAAPAP